MEEYKENKFEKHGEQQAQENREEQEEEVAKEDEELEEKKIDVDINNLADEMVVNYYLGNLKIKDEYYVQYELPKYNQNQIINSFFDFDGYEDMKEYLKNNNCVCLYETIDSGKRNIAINLLNDLFLKDIEIIEITEEDYSRFFHKFKPKKATGYIFKDFNFEMYGNQKMIYLDILKDKLKKANSAVVVLSGENRISSSSNLKLFQCVLPEKTEYILKKMLDYNLDDFIKSNEIIQQLRLDELSEEIREYKPGRNRLEKIVEKIINDSKYDRLNEDIFYYLKYDEHDNLKKWLLDIKSKKQLGYLLSLCLFNGCREQLVVQKGKVLEKILKKKTNEKDDHMDEEFQCDSDFWKSLRAEKNYDDGTIIFSGESTRNHILGIISKDIYELKDILLDFLSACGKLRNILEVRALGMAIRDMVCSENDFDEVYGRVILPWIKSDDFYIRFNAAAALSFMAGKEETSNIVFKVHRKWVDKFEKIGYRRRWISVFMMGETLGRISTEYSMKRLTQIDTDKFPQLKKAVVISLSKIFRSGKRDQIHYEDFLRFFLGEIRLAHSKERRYRLMNLVLKVIMYEKAINRNRDKVSRVITILNQGNVGEIVGDIILEISKVPKFNKTLYSVFNKWKYEFSEDEGCTKNIKTLIGNIIIDSSRDNRAVIEEIERRFNMEGKR